MYKRIVNNIFILGLKIGLPRRMESKVFVSVKEKQHLCSYNILGTFFIYLTQKSSMVICRNGIKLYLSELCICFRTVRIYHIHASLGAAVHRHPQQRRQLRTCFDLIDHHTQITQWQNNKKQYVLWLHVAV